MKEIDQSLRLDCGHPEDPGHPATVSGKVIMGWKWVLDGERRICHACADKRILDCGHHPSPHSHISTGYGSMDGKTYCYECMAGFDRDYMIKDGVATMYLAKNPKGTINSQEASLEQSIWQVSNWPGSLKFSAYCEERRNDVKVGGFIGPDGQQWKFRCVTNHEGHICSCQRGEPKVKVK